MERISVTYGNDKITVEWDGANASAPIRIDGEPTQYQTADARHRTAEAVRLACSLVWGPVFGAESDAIAEGHDPDSSAVTIWDDVEYQAEEEGGAK